MTSSTYRENAQYDCPVINDLVVIEVKVTHIQEFDSDGPVAELSLDLRNSAMTNCTGVMGCGVATVQENSVSYDWDICPFKKTLNPT